MTIFQLPGYEGQLKKHAAGLAPKKAAEEEHPMWISSLYCSENPPGVQQP